MVGIVAYGVYVPRQRMSRDLLAQAWGAGSMGGEKAVANYDEDPITMAVSAARDCIGEQREGVDALYFASTTAPYKEKQSSSLIAAALDLRGDILTSDFGNSLRSGSSALLAGIDAVGNKSARQVLVAIGDCRLGPPGSDLEQIFGDGAAAFLLGDSASEIIANITGSYAVSDDFTDFWRADRETFTEAWEDRFTNIWGYANNVRKAVTGIMGKYRMKPADFSRLVLYAPNARQQAALARGLGFDVKKQLSGLVFNAVGHTGTALAPMMLAEALEEASPGDRILFVSYGDGCQGLIIEVTGNISKIERGSLKRLLGSKALLDTYERYLRFRNLVAREAPRRPPSGNSLPILWRQNKSLIRFYGSKCRRCGQIHHPVQRVCYRCGSLDEYEEVRLARKGTIFSYTEDYITLSPQLPQVLAIVILEDGARVYVEVNEVEPQAPLDPPRKIGMPVEMAFRKMAEANGLNNYYWKALPLRR